MLHWILKPVSYAVLKFPNYEVHILSIFLISSYHYRSLVLGTFSCTQCYHLWTFIISNIQEKNKQTNKKKSKNIYVFFSSLESKS